MLRLPYEQINYSKIIRLSCAPDFKQRFQHAISKIDGVTLDIQGDSYIITEE